MRNFKVVLIVLTLFFVGMAISDAAKNKPDDSEWYAQIWDYAAETQNSYQLWSVFKTIELKDEKEYIPALDRFLTIRRRNTPHRAQAIYTLSKLGSKYCEEDFNLLLEDKSHFETMLWGRELNEKYEVLKYMNELDLSLSQNAIVEIKTDIAKVLLQKSPKHAIDLIAGLKLNGIELSDKEKKPVATECSAKWHNINPESLKQSGIQLDWESMFETEYAKPRNERFRIHDLYKLLLSSSDEKIRMKFASEWANDPDPGRLKVVYQHIMAASLGDEKAVNEIINKLNFEYIHYSEPVVDFLPDKLLLEMLSFMDARPERSDAPFIVELMNRGYENEVNDFLDNREKFARELYVSYKPERGDYQLDGVRIGALYPISQVDADRYFNILWDLFEENPQKRYFAKQFTQYPRNSRWQNEFPGGDGWMTDNPEKLASAIKLIMGSNRMPADQIKRDREAGLGLNSKDYWENETAIVASLRLPESTFKKNFSEIDNETMTTSAYLVGNHFKAKWAYKKDQQRFYEMYGRKRN